MFGSDFKKSDAFVLPDVTLGEEGVALGWQPVGEQDDAVGQASEGAHRGESFLQIGTTLGDDGVELFDDLVDCFFVARAEPVVAAVDEHGRNLVIKKQDLKTSVRTERGDHPLEGMDGALPFRSFPFSFIRISQPCGGGVDRLVQHRSRTADDEDNEITGEFYAREVLAPIDIGNGHWGEILGGQVLLFAEERRECVLHRAGLLQQEQQFTLAAAELQLVLSALRSDVVQFELGCREDFSESVDFGVAERDVALHRLRAFAEFIHVRFVHFHF